MALGGVYLWSQSHCCSAQDRRRRRPTHLRQEGLVTLPESEREEAEQEVGEIEQGVLWVWLVAE